jgi:hypothetical protein
MESRDSPGRRESPRLDSPDELPSPAGMGAHSRHNSIPQNAFAGMMESGRGVAEYSTLQREIEELREYIASQDRVKSRPNKIIVFLSNVYDRLFHYWILTKGQFQVCLSYFPVRAIAALLLAAACIFVVFNIDHIPGMIKQAKHILRKHVHQITGPETDAFTYAYNGFYYRTMRPNIEYDSFNNKHLENGRTVLTCPVRFPVPDGWTLVPAEETEDVVNNVVSNHYWSSSAMILNKYAAYPTLSLRSQLARPYPQATNEARAIPELVSPEVFNGMGPWFEVGRIGNQEWVQQNLLPVNTRECLMIVFSFASRGYRDDHVEDVVPACELCSANILIRKKIDAEE